MLLDVPFALTLGLIAGLLNFVPNLGPIIASIPAILVGLLESPTQAIYVAILYLALQAVDGYIFTPLVQQQTVNVPPAMTIAGQLLMGVLFGAWGLLLATPLLAGSIVLIKGELHFCYGGRELTYTLLPERPKRKTVNKMKNRNRRARAGTGPFIPPANHAWRNFQFGKGRLGLAEPKATSDQKVNSEGFSK